jgi:hypothetical protein
MKIYTITILNHRALSWNSLYKSPHWHYRSLIVQSHHDITQAACIDAGYSPYSNSLIEEKVDIRFYAYYKDHPADSSNICTKVYEDGLKKILLKDDDNRYVRSVYSESINAKENMLVIEIIPIVVDENDSV